MKYIYLLFTVTLLCIYSCNTDNYDYTEDIADPYVTDTIDVDNILAYTIPDNDTYLEDGRVLEYLPEGGLTNWVIASSEVDVTCANNGISTSFSGSEYFQFTFYDNFGEPVIFNASFTGYFDNELKTVSMNLNPACPAEQTIINYEITGDRMSGTITGEYFYLADDLIEPFISCENFISTGIVDITFDLPLQDCQ